MNQQHWHKRLGFRGRFKNNLAQRTFEGEVTTHGRDEHGDYVRFYDHTIACQEAQAYRAGECWACNAFIKTGIPQYNPYRGIKVQSVDGYVRDIELLEPIDEWDMQVYEAMGGIEKELKPARSDGDDEQ